MMVTTCLVNGADARRDLRQNDSMKETVVDLLSGCSFGILKAAVLEAGLAEALTDPKADITVFAPTNTAFRAALAELDMTKEELLASDILADILKYHVISGKVKADDLPEGETTVASLLGSDIKILKDGDIMINDATVEYADLEARNGIVHVIDKVLLPPRSPAVKTMDIGVEMLKEDSVQAMLG